jgi:hypothetical protein
MCVHLHLVSTPGNVVMDDGLPPAYLSCLEVSGQQSQQ